MFVPCKGIGTLHSTSPRFLCTRGSSHAPGGFPESSSRTGRVFRRVGQVLLHQGASLEHLRSLLAESSMLEQDSSSPTAQERRREQNRLAQRRFRRELPSQSHPYHSLC